MINKLTTVAVYLYCAITGNNLVNSQNMQLAIYLLKNIKNEKIKFAV